MGDPREKDGLNTAWLRATGVTHLSIGMSLDGSIEGRRDAAPDPRRSEPRLSEGRLLDIMGLQGIQRWKEDGGWYGREMNMVWSLI